jgi:hypothetical protein
VGSVPLVGPGCRLETGPWFPTGIGAASHFADHFNRSRCDSGRIDDGDSGGKKTKLLRMDARNALTQIGKWTFKWEMKLFGKG